MSIVSRSAASRLIGPALATAGLIAVAAPPAAQARDFKPDRVERVLAAAGFEAVPANTPQRASEIAALKPKRIVAQPNGSGFTYVYADPRGCDCLYLGDARDYAQYQRLALRQQIAQRKADAAADARFAALNWSTWGPYGDWWWNGPVFVHSHGGFHGGGGHPRSHGR